MADRPRAALALAATVLAAGLVAGCGIADATRDPRGHRVDPELLAELVPGVQTRADVRALLGSPSTTAVFGDETWFYIGGLTRNRIGRTDEVLEQEVVAIHFDRAGVVRRVEVIDKASAQEIDPVARITPTPGNDRSFLGQVLGNIGRFSPGNTGRGQTPGPGVP